MTRRITAKQRDEIVRAIEHHEGLRQSYWWSGDNGNQQQRDRRADTLSYSTQIRNGGHLYTYTSAVQMSRNRTYYRGEFTKDGVKGDVRLFRRLLV